MSRYLVDFKATFYLIFCLALTLTTQALGGSIISKVPSSNWLLNDFVLVWSNTDKALQIYHKNDSEKKLWSSIPNRSFVEAGHAEVDYTEKRGSFSIKEKFRWTCKNQSLDEINLVEVEEKLQLKGELFNCSKKRPKIKYELTFKVVQAGHLQFKLQFGRKDVTYARIFLASHPNEKFYGFGEQFSHMELKGRKIPILTQEGGIGRGRPLITTIVNWGSRGSGGNEFSTYAPVPHYISSDLHSLFLENKEYSTFDLQTNRTVITVFGPEVAITGRLLHGNSILDLVTSFTEYSGRMEPLPSWVHQGAIVGMQGGTSFVRKIYKELQKRKTPVSAFWLQDWEGERKTATGSQLWWNWELDRKRYPDWEAMLSDFARENIRVLGYVNPFLVDVKSSGKQSFQRNMYSEAAAKGLLVVDKNNQVYPIVNTDFAAGLLDITNPETREWIKTIIKEEMVGIGLSGWMADFGEALPMDAVLHKGSPATFHNKYPEEWARLNREVIKEVGGEKEMLFFSRSGFTQSPGLTTLFWLGDQLVTWDRYDGFISALKGQISGGFSGYSLNHSDIGGYSTFKLAGLGLSREKNLFMRWAEASAFFPVYRTHEGNMPEKNFQFYSDEETYAQFDRFSKVYVALSEYRQKLFEEAANLGWPVVRHPAMHFPDDKVFINLPDRRIQFLFGDKFIVAPVVAKNIERRKVYLPAGRWINLWSNQLYDSSEKGRWYEVKAPVGEPPVFYQQGCTVGQDLRAKLIAAGVI
ncbi:MAG: alpha-glucosidase [Zetaproteobacteria bacterium]|nr:alpha-glucosidase [Pseudobdellovibrionaceae bacterium]